MLGSRRHLLAVARRMRHRHLRRRSRSTTILLPLALINLRFCGLRREAFEFSSSFSESGSASRSSKSANAPSSASSKSKPTSSPSKSDWSSSTIPDWPSGAPAALSLSRNPSPKPKIRLLPPLLPPQRHLYIGIGICAGGSVCGREAPVESYTPKLHSVWQVLDYMLGEGHSALLRRAELKTFVDFHGNEAGKGGDLTHDETTIIAGALQLTEKTAKDAMTPISNAFSLDLGNTECDSGNGS